MKLIKFVLTAVALTVPLINNAGAADQAALEQADPYLELNGWSKEEQGSWIKFHKEDGIKLRSANVTLEIHGKTVGIKTEATVSFDKKRIKFRLPESLASATAGTAELVATVEVNPVGSAGPVTFSVRSPITSKGYVASDRDIQVSALSIDGTGSSRSDSLVPPTAVSSTDSTTPPNLGIKEYLLSQIAEAKSIEYYDDTPEKTVALFHDLFDALAKAADAAAALPSLEEKQKAWIALNAKLRQEMDTIYAQNVGVRTAWRNVLIRVKIKFYEGKDTQQLPLKTVAVALHDIADAFSELAAKYKDDKDILAAANKAVLGTSTATSSTVSGDRNRKSSRTSCFRLLLGL